MKEATTTINVPHLAQIKPASYNIIDAETDINHFTHGILQSFWSETILTAFFVSVILTAKYSKDPMISLQKGEYPQD